MLIYTFIIGILLFQFVDLSLLSRPCFFQFEGYPIKSQQSFFTWPSFPQWSHLGLSLLFSLILAFDAWKAIPSIIGFCIDEIILYCSSSTTRWYSCPNVRSSVMLSIWVFTVLKTASRPIKKLYSFSHSYFSDSFFWMSQLQPPQVRFGHGAMDWISSQRPFNFVKYAGTMNFSCLRRVMALRSS